MQTSAPELTRAQSTGTEYCRCLYSQQVQSIVDDCTCEQVQSIVDDCTCQQVQSIVDDRVQSTVIQSTVVDCTVVQ
jgi:hypothetical protein